MARIFLIVSIVLSIGSAVMAFLTKGDLKKVEDEQGRLVRQAKAVVSELGKASEVLDQTKGELAAAQKLAEDRQTEIGGLNRQLAGAKDEASKSKQEKSDVDKRLADAEGTVEKAKKDIEKVQGLEKELADLRASSMEAVAAKEREIERLRAEVVVAAKKPDGAKSPRGGEVADQMGGGVGDAREKKVSRKSAPKEGEIISYDTSWNFAVVSIGDRSGVTPESVLYAMRGDNPVAKLRVTKVFSDRTVVLPEEVSEVKSLARRDQRAPEVAFFDAMSKAFAPKKNVMRSVLVREGDRVVIAQGSEKKDERAAAVAEAKSAAINPSPAVVAPAPKADAADPLLAIPGLPGLPADDKPAEKPVGGDSKDAAPDPFKLNFN